MLHPLLCSDGLTKHLSAEEIGHLLEESGSPAEHCGRLVSLTNERGGSDNVTVVIARLE